MRKILALVFTFCFFAGVAFCEEVVDKTLAIVNGEPLMSSEFNKILEPMIQQYMAMTPVTEQSEAKLNELKNQILEQRIEQILLVQEAKKQKIKVPKRELDEALTTVKKRFPSEEVFQSELKKEGLSQVQFEKRIEEQMMVQKLVEKEMKNNVKPPSDAEIKKFYDNVRAKMKGEKLNLPKEEEETVDAVAKLLKRMSSEQIRLNQIYIKCDKNASSQEKKAAENRVANVKKELASGASFSATSEKYSEDSILKQRKGDMGFVVKGDLDKRLEDKAFSMVVGQYTKEPIQTESGYHFLRVTESRASSSFTYDDVKNDLAEVLFRQNSKKLYDKWIDGLKSKANIKINQVW
ncbi:MAG: SurA N-terminal domain-containing protein [Endomicrobiaceae bacterium]|nr:SurA N-terminal domain-containing protein [Endomicrobiaceae bacterium]